jgi:hypothetical protein
MQISTLLLLVTAFQSEDAFAELYYSKFLGIVFFHFVLIPVIILGVSWSLTPRSIDAEFELSRFNFQMEAVKLATGVTPTCWRVRFRFLVIHY